MKRHLIYCGLYARELTTDQADALVRELAIQHFPNGHTIHEATGRWRGLTMIVDEPTLIVEVWEAAGFGEPALGPFAADYKELALQESVVILSTKCEAVVI